MRLGLPTIPEIVSNSSLIQVDRSLYCNVRNIIGRYNLKNKARQCIFLPCKLESDSVK